MADEQEKMLKHLEDVNAVALEYLKGQDVRQISNALDIPRPRVAALLKEWREMATSNQAINARAKEALAGMDQHYGHLIDKAYEVVEAADLNANLSAKTNAIKLIVDIEAKRMDMLHRAGLIDNRQMAEEMLELERKQEILVRILSEVVNKCDHCRPKVASRMSTYSEKVMTFDV